MANANNPTNFDTSIKQKIEDAAEILVGRAVPEVNVLGITGDPIPDVDIYDFATYRYLRKPELSATENFGDYSAGLDYFLSEIHRIIREVVNQEVIRYVIYSDAGGIIISSEDAVLTIYEDGNVVGYTFTFTDHYRETVIEECYDMFLSYLSVDLYELVVRVFIEHEERVYEIFRSWLAFWVPRYEDIGTPFPIEEIIAIWQGGYLQILQALEQQYPDTNYLTYIDNSIKYNFIPFREDQVNFGIRLIYRQEWQKLGNQKGPVLKTIPLGPKQVEKVSIKTVTTQRVTRNVETVETTEQSRESESRESNSRDIVSEAADSMNWKVEANATYSAGTGSASLSAGAGSESSSSSSDTKKSLNEAAEKSASKQKKEVKLVITTERSANDEFSRTSEIQNPNEDIAITYVYNEMYQKFSVYTSLAELQSVIFIPEKLPHPTQIDENFIKRYDWILRRALLDRSFDEDITNILNEFEEDSIIEADNDPFRASFQKSTDTMASFGNFTGKFPDFYKSTGQNYMEQLDKQRVINNRKKLREKRKNRLFQHLRDNILHYMRAIWASEDPEQRMQRYYNIQVPTQWEFVPNEGSAYEGMTGAWPGEFVPNPTSNKPLSEIINPAGPIGWAVNYAVFYLKSDSTTLNLNKALSKLRSHYVRYTHVIKSNTVNPLTVCSVLDPHWNQVEYTITVTGQNIAVSVVTAFVSYPLPAEALTVSQLRDQIQFEGLYLKFESPVADGDQYTISLSATGILQDPEESVRKILTPLPNAQNEAATFDPILPDLILTFPELSELIVGMDWAVLTDDEKRIARDYYHRYLMKKENTRKLLIKSSNPMIDLEVGETPALEQFKRLHRAVDVVKALEEYSTVRYENLRKQTRIEKSILSDPDIENVTVVGNGVDLQALVGAAVAAAIGSSAEPQPQPTNGNPTE